MFLFFLLNLNQFYQTGENNKEIFDVIDIIQKDTLRDYFIENSKPYEEKKSLKL